MVCSAEGVPYRTPAAQRTTSSVARASYVGARVGAVAPIVAIAVACLTLESRGSDHGAWLLGHAPGIAVAMIGSALVGSALGCWWGRVGAVRSEDAAAGVGVLIALVCLLTMCALDSAVEIAMHQEWSPFVRSYFERGAAECFLVGIVPAGIIGAVCGWATRAYVERDHDLR